MPASGTSDALSTVVMIEAITDFFERKSKTKTRPAMVRLAPKPARCPEPESRGQQFGFTKVFRWPVPAEQTPKPTTVEVVGSFSEWCKLPLSYDPPTKTWQLIQRDIPGNHTHRYVMLVDGKPTYDKTRDGMSGALRPRGTSVANRHCKRPPRYALVLPDQMTLAGFRDGVTRRFGMKGVWNEGCQVEIHKIDARRTGVLTQRLHQPARQ